MNNFSDLTTTLSSLLGGGFAGSLFTYFIGKSREKRIAKLEIVLVPYIGKDIPLQSDMLCYAKLSMKHCPQPVKLLETIAKLGESQQIQAWGSRLGINPVIKENNRFHFYNLKNGDIINIVFLTPKSELNFDNFLDSHLFDINSEPFVHIQKVQSAWYE